jgi:hypothetical protein
MVQSRVDIAIAFSVVAMWARNAPNRTSLGYAFAICQYVGRASGGDLFKNATTPDY